MKVLLVHPEDSPLGRVWPQSRWDFVIDLGWAGSFAYAEWTRRMGCPVRGFWSYARGPEDFQQVGEILKPFLGVLVDAQGLDWWEILAPLRIHEMLQLVVVRHALRDLGPVELVGTRLHPIASLFGNVAGQEVRYIGTGRESAAGRRWRNLRTSVRRLSLPQILQVALDKWDTDYRLRSGVTPRRKIAEDGAVLLPSGYENVTRILNSYAQVLPERRFLLVTTRKSGETQRSSKNVDTAPLSAFARSQSSDATRREMRSLEEGWKSLARTLEGSEQLAAVNGPEKFRDIGQSFGQWLRIRDAWREVLRIERICAVLCGDENSPTNRIPVLLAREKGLPTAHCDHGALNALLSLRSPACGAYVVKGEMERDYMARISRFDGRRIEVGAPAGTVSPARPADRDTIVFFSEEYELTQGRSRILYQEILPPLCMIGRSHGKRVIVKLHPFESFSLRKDLVRAVLSPEDGELVDLVHGSLTPELMETIWFAVTVESSVSVDCAIRGIPCFLCGWFVTPVAGYGEQFVKYGAAQALQSPLDIAGIPEMLQGFEVTPEVQRKLWNPIEAAGLESLLGGS